MAHILIVEDDFDIARLMLTFFRRHQYTAVTVHSGQQFRAYFNDPTQPLPDLIFLDLMLPDTPGLELYQWLRTQPQAVDIPVIVVSAVRSVEKRVELLKMGVADYLVKPRPMEDMLASAETHLKLSALRRAQKDAEARAELQSQYLQAINQVGQIASQYLDMELMLTQSAKGVVTFLDCVGCHIYLLDPNKPQDMLRWQAGYGLQREEKKNTAVASSLVHEASLTLQNNYAEHEINVPITRGAVSLGVIQIYLNPTTPLPQEIAQAVEILAVQLSTAITNAYLFDDIRLHNQQLREIVQENKRLLAIERQQRQQAELLTRMSQVISSSLNMRQVLDQAMESLRSMIEVEEGSILLYNEKAGQLTFASTLGSTITQLRHAHISVHQGLAGQAVREKRLILDNNVQENATFFRGVDEVTGVQTRSILCVPLIAQGRVIGVLELLNKVGEGFTDLDSKLATSAATTIAIALDNARLYAEQARLLHEKQLSQRQLVQSEKMSATGRLAASMAHEINNPLQAVHSCLQLILQFDLPLDKQREYLEMAGEEVERLIGIATRILEFSRPSTGQTEKIYINRIINQVMQLAQKHISHHRIKVQQVLDIDVPHIQVIPDQIAQVFLNIILNALDTMPENGTLIIATHVDAEWVKTSFMDTGEGMSPEVLNHLFEPFFTTKEGHAGLGLTISYGIIARHRGKIIVSSQVGEGSTVEVYLPRHQQSPELSAL